MTPFNKAQLQKLYHYAMSLCSDKDLALDLVQSTIERYLRNNTQATSPMAYARTILRNLFIDHHRHKNKAVEEVYDDEVVSLHMGMQTLEQLMINRDELDKIWASLKPFETEVLYLWAVEGFTVEDVAKQLDIPKGTVLARIHRLRTKLKTQHRLPQEGGVA